MKSKAKKLKGTARRIDVEVPKKKVDSTLEEILGDIKRSVRVNGFRQGKAPMDMIRREYMQEAREELKKKLIPEAYQQALRDNDIAPVSYPQLSDVLLHPDGSLRFSATVDASPEVKLKKYKGIKVKAGKISVKDKEIEDALGQIRNMNAEFNDIDRPLKKGDFAVCDAQMSCGGEMISAKRENMWIEVDKESSLFGVGAELEGLKKGDEKDAEVELPEEYANKEYAGKKAVMHIIIKQTKEKVLPEINDDLASKVGKKNIEEVKQEISSQLLQRKEADLAADLKNQVAQKLLKDTSFEVPATMVKRQLEVLLKQYESDLERKGVDKNTIQQNRPELEKKLEKTAREKVKLYFILDAIADKENIEIKESEVDDWLKALAGSYNKKFEEVKKYYREHDLLQGVAEELREAKTLDMLVEEAEKNIK